MIVYENEPLCILQSNSTNISQENSDVKLIQARSKEKAASRVTIKRIMRLVI